MAFYPSQVSAYIALGHCNRYLKFLSEFNSTGKGFSSAAPESGDDLRGKEAENKVKKILEENEYRDFSNKKHEILSNISSNQKFFVSQHRISGRLSLNSEIDYVEISGYADILLYDPAQKNVIVLECKSSQRIKSAAQLQVALYAHFVAEEFKCQQVKGQVVMRDRDTDEIPTDFLTQSPIDDMTLAIRLADAKAILELQRKISHEKKMPHPHFKEYCEHCTFLSKCVEQATTSKLDWGVLGLAPSESAALVKEGKIDAQPIEKGAIKEAFQHGLKHSVTALRTLYKLRSDYYCADSSEDEVKIYNSGRLPAPITGLSLIQIFVHALSNPQQSRLSALCFIIRRVTADGTMGSKEQANILIGDRGDAGEIDALKQFQAALKKTLEPDPARPAAFHFYFWDTAEANLISDRLYAHSTSHPCFEQVIDALHDRDAPAAQERVRAPRITFLKKHLKWRAELASIGISLLETAFLRWSGRACDIWLEAGSTVTARWLDLASTETLSVDNVRAEFRRKPRFSDTVPFDLFNKLMRDKMTFESYAECWLLTLIRFEENLKNLYNPPANSFPLLAIESNPIATKEKLVKIPLIHAAFSYLEGAHDHVVRKWFANHLRPVERLIASGKAIELHTPKWAPKKCKCYEQLICSEKNIEFNNFRCIEKKCKYINDLIKENLDNHENPFPLKEKCNINKSINKSLEIMSTLQDKNLISINKLNKKSIKKSKNILRNNIQDILKSLKLSGYTRAVTIISEDQFLLIDDITKDSIALRNVTVDDHCTLSPLSIRANPWLNPRLGGLEARQRVTAARQENQPLTGADGKPIERWIIIDDCEPVEPKIREKLDAFLKKAETNPDQLGSLNWWRKNGGLPDNKILSEDRIKTIREAYKIYLKLRDECKYEYNDYRNQLRQDSESKEIIAKLNDLERKIDKTLSAHKSSSEIIDNISVEKNHQDVLDIIEYFTGNRLSLLQGPPGTGKTEFAALAIIIWALVQLAEQPHDTPRVAVTGLSHNSVSNVLYRCAAIAPLVLAAWEKAMGTTSSQLFATIERWSADKEDYLFKENLQSSGRGKRINIIDKLTIINKSIQIESLLEPSEETHIRIVGFVTAQLPNLVKEETADFFQYLVFDEASQTKVQDAVLALSMLDPIEGQILGIGDHRQLGPIERGLGDGDRRFIVRHHRPYDSFYNFMKEQIKQQSQNTVKSLTYTYRLQEDAWHLIAPIYLKDGVKLTGKQREGTNHPHPGCKLLHGSVDWEGVCLFSYDSEISSEDAQYNLIEIAIAERLLRDAHPSIFNDFIALTPFHSQREKLNETLNEIYKEKNPGQSMQTLKLADTVDSMQGAEKDTILFSAVSTAATLSQMEEFALDIRRTNVAFSRSKKRLIVIASAAFLNYTPSSPELLDMMDIWKMLRHYATPPLTDPSFQVEVAQENGDMKKILVTGFQYRPLGVPPL